MNDLITRKSGRAGHVTLNRPQALNALTHPMCLDLEQAMNDWMADDTVELLLIDAAGEKAFCAGGDIVKIYNEGKSGQVENALRFWRDEYRLNHAISTYAKPYVAIMDGIVMGGGVGISAHGSHRVVTERTMFAMPECAIGLLPDVGGTYLLGQMPGACGEYAGLTGARLSGADCIYAGLADYFVPSDKLESLKTALLETGDVAVLQEYATMPEGSALAENRTAIDAAFALDDVADIMQALKTDPSDFAKSALKNSLRGAPLCMKITLIAIREARQNRSLEMALRNEYRIVSTCLQEGELIEGIRAMVIDKDRAPKWKYPTLESVPQKMIDRLYQPAAGGDFAIDK
ncbi:MAG: enoyl-CoA hydratase/isomerase family protein [Amylibacter sp.]|nr:enoyl-CoA hydratase/isomerase family protein [Amylibacter sp.]